jgi:hypothetical protein
MTSLHNEITNHIEIEDSTKNDAVICAIALNEEPYLDEWIQYHLALGFSHIYLYDNSDNNCLKHKNSNTITIIHFPGKTKQLEAYKLFISQYKTKHQWAAVIDCDEFIVLKKHSNIRSFLNEYHQCHAIGLNWLMFGTSREKTYVNQPVTKRFRYCSNHINRHIKCIVQLIYVDNWPDPHHPILTKGHIYDTNHNIINGPFNPRGNCAVACIHHYYTKSEQEFREKIERGRADISQKRSLNELVDIHSKNNDIYNSDAWNFYSVHVLSSVSTSS